MPSQATVRGILQDANLAPIVGGKIVATLQGSDTRAEYDAMPAAQRRSNDLVAVTGV